MSPPKEPSSEPSPHAERLQKVLAAAGVGSRRDCEVLILEGRVEVDGEVVTALGTKVDPDVQAIRVDGEPIKQKRRVYYVLNKPMGVVTTNFDPAGRTRVVDLVPDKDRVFPVGRLDRASEGLIIVTNDGELSFRLTHPKFGVEKEYLVRIAGMLEEGELEKLRRGIHLSDGLARVVSLRILGSHKQSTDLEIILREGKNREIRRILAKVGHKVLSLKRVAIGSLRLGELAPGEMRRLSETEVRSLLTTKQTNPKVESKRKGDLAKGRKGKGKGEEKAGSGAVELPKRPIEPKMPKMPGSKFKPPVEPKMPVAKRPVDSDFDHDDDDDELLDLNDFLPTDAENAAGDRRGSILEYGDEEGDAAGGEEPKTRSPGRGKVPGGKRPPAGRPAGRGPARGPGGSSRGPGGDRPPRERSE